VFGRLFLIEQSDKSIVDKPGRHVVVSKIDQLEQSPRIENRKDGSFDTQQTLMQFSPLLFRVVALL
jgi:hypothetical protein